MNAQSALLATLKGWEASWIPLLMVLGPLALNASLVSH